jgi:AbrB family looped-hinge helix DNA binding protein
MAMAYSIGMKDLLVPIDPAGRIVLPKKVREDLAIKAGDVFKVSIQGAAVTLTPERETAGFIRKGKALVLSTPGSATLSAEKVNELLELCRGEPMVRGTETNLGRPRRR